MRYSRRNQRLAKNGDNCIIYIVESPFSASRWFLRL